MLYLHLFDQWVWLPAISRELMVHEHPLLWVHHFLHKLYQLGPNLLQFQGEIVHIPHHQGGQTAS